MRRFGYYWKEGFRNIFKHGLMSVVIPCHRVVGSNGSLTGYAGGLDVKRALLKLEGLDLSQFK